MADLLKFKTFKCKLYHRYLEPLKLMLVTQSLHLAVFSFSCILLNLNQLLLLLKLLKINLHMWHCRNIRVCLKCGSSGNFPQPDLHGSKETDGIFMLLWFLQKSTFKSKRFDIIRGWKNFSYVWELSDRKWDYQFTSWHSVQTCVWWRRLSHDYWPIMSLKMTYVYFRDL